MQHNVIPVPHLRRDPAWLAARLGDETSLFLPVWRGRNLIVSVAGAGPRAAFLKRHQLAAASSESVLLGIEEDRAYFALDLSAIETPLGSITAEMPVEFTAMVPVFVRLVGKLTVPLFRIEKAPALVTPLKVELVLTG